MKHAICRVFGHKWVVAWTDKFTVLDHAGPTGVSQRPMWVIRTTSVYHCTRCGEPGFSV